MRCLMRQEEEEVESPADREGEGHIAFLVFNLVRPAPDKGGSVKIWNRSGSDGFASTISVTKGWGNGMSQIMMSAKADMG